MTGETKTTSRWSSSSLRRTLSSASSTTSLFGNFFRHLSTSSLAQLATKLASTTSLHNPGIEEKEGSEEECDANDDLDESLSSVFKGYLLNRSILTDSPVDLSVLYIDDDENDGVKKDFPLESKSDSENGDDDDLEDSAYESSHPPSKTTSRQCSKASLISLDSANELYCSAELSDSLLHCLDGHDPTQSVPLIVKSNGESNIHSCKTKGVQHTAFSQEVCNDGELSSGLHSCSPDGRSHSLLKTKQGTPVPQRESTHSGKVASGHGVMFETSL